MRRLPSLLAIAAVAIWGCSAKEEPLIVDADQDPAQELYDQIDAIELPVPDPAKADSEEYEEQFMTEYKSAVQERGGLIFELCNQFPNGGRTASLFDLHWNSVMKTNIEEGDLNGYITQVDSVLKDDSPEALSRQVAYWTAFLSSFRDKDDSLAILGHAEGFSKEYPTDQRGVILYNFASVAKGASAETMTKALRAISQKYPDSPQVGRAGALLPLLPHVGKKFEIDFSDVTTGKKVTMASLRGKVVVVDFWATWCQPCVDAMPYLKSVYADYKSKGVEFVGVSLDNPIAQGGLDQLTNFVSEYAITWPQYYADTDRSLAAKYSVSALPAMFILDKKGVIRSVDGRSVLIRTIDELLEE